MQGFGGDGGEGVSGGSPAPVFEILGEVDQQLEDAAPFRDMPISRGRPKGSPNKRTAAMRELYLKAFPHPMMQAGMILRMTVEDLAKSLVCSRYDAAELQRKTRADLLPYLESKMPTAIDVKDERLPVLVVGETARGLRQARSAGALAIDDDLVELIAATEQNQGLDAAEDPRSHGDGSHDEAQGADPAGETDGTAAD